MNYIYSKDQCAVKPQGYYQKYFGKDHWSQGNNEHIFLINIIIISYFVPLFYLIGLFGDVTKHFL